jgi:tetratricopeptide (TPR) repeat protein
MLFAEARAAGDRAHDATLSLRALKGLYQLAFYRGDMQRCCAIAQEQLDLGVTSGDRRFEAEGHVAMANALDVQRIRRKDARAHLAAATAIFEEVRFPVGLAVSLVVTATHLCWTGELADARACSERAMQIYATHPPPARLKITGLLTLAIATLLSGDGARAKPHALEAVELARSSGYRLLEAAALGNLADAEAVAGEYAAAIDHVKQSREIWAETNPGLPNEDAHIALWSAVLGDLATARVHAFRALEGDAAFRDTSFWPQERYWSVAQALHACGETEAAANALERARALTAAALDQMDEPEHERFLALPWHRDIIAAAEHGVWPDPPR